MAYDVAESIKAINPEAQFEVLGEDLDNITWLNGTAPISKADIQAKQAELQAHYDIKQYQRDRKVEYPEIGDQLDMLWHSIDQDAALKQKYFAFHQAILAIKSKHPK